jgi:hypothetical protein
VTTDDEIPFNATSGVTELEFHLEGAEHDRDGCFDRPCQYCAMWTVQTHTERIVYIAAKLNEWMSKHNRPPEQWRPPTELSPELKLELDDPDMTDSEEAIVLVQSGKSPTGVYTCDIHYNADVGRTLNPDQAIAYFHAMLLAALTAEYELAQLKQMHLGVGLSLHRSVEFIIEVRKARTPLDYKAVRPLIVKPFVSVSSMEPLVAVTLSGADMKWQWNADDVRQHVMQVMEARHIADLDAGYRKFLTTGVGLSRAEAEERVDDLKNYRTDSK